MIGIRASSMMAQLDAWRRKLREGYADRAATRIADTMQATARNEAPKATEAMAFSTSVVSRQRNDYATNASGARELNATAELFPEPPVPGAGEALVVVGVTYGSLVNDGTIHQNANPWFDRAALQTKAQAGPLAEQEWKA